MIEGLTLGEWVIVAGAAVLIGAAKTGVFGGAMVVIPLMASVFPAKTSTGVLLPLLCFGDLLGVLLYRRYARWDVLVRLFPFAAAGVVAGYFVMHSISDAALKPMIGVMVLVLLVLQYAMAHEYVAVCRTHVVLAALIGLLAGFTTMTANASGPIMMLYLLMLQLDKRMFAGTMAWGYLCMNLFKLPFSAHLGLITRDSLALNGVLIPAILVGGAGGYLFVRFIPQRIFAIVMQILAAAGAVYLLM